MQRQSLGSPVSKVHSHGEGGAGKEEELIVIEQKRKDQMSFLLTDNNSKSQKSNKSPPQIERFVHLIPVIIVFCFLILYLCSYDPSQKDLVQFKGFKRSLRPIDAMENDNAVRFSERKKGDVLAIRSLKNLQVMRRHAPKYRFQRKIVDF